MSISKLRKMLKLKSYSFIPAGGFHSFTKKNENKKSGMVIQSISPMSFLSYKKEAKNFYYSLYSFVLESVSTILSFIL